jgi:hypothetical protein
MAYIAYVNHGYSSAEAQTYAIANGASSHLAATLGEAEVDTGQIKLALHHTSLLHELCKRLAVHLDFRHLHPFGKETLAE